MGANDFKHNKVPLFALKSVNTLLPTPNWLPYVCTLIQKVKIGHKGHGSINKPRLSRDCASYFILKSCAFLAQSTLE